MWGVSLILSHAEILLQYTDILRYVATLLIIQFPLLYTTLLLRAIGMSYVFILYYFASSSSTTWQAVQYTMFHLFLEYVAEPSS